jgi:hypothetical protein
MNAKFNALINECISNVKMSEKARSNLKSTKSSVMQSLMKCDIEECIDEELSVRVNFPPEGKPYLRDEVLLALNVSPLEIVAAGPLADNSKWIITLNSKEAALRVMTNAPVIRGRVARVTTLNSNIVKVRVHWLPINVPMSAVVVYLSQFGVVHSVSWDYSSIKGYELVKTTIRNVVIELDEDCDIPSLGLLVHNKKSHKMLCTIPGRGPVCFRCNTVGHTRSECDVPKCRHCDMFGHMSEECAVKNTFAAKVVSKEVCKDTEVTVIEDEPADEDVFLMQAALEESQGRKYQRLSDSDSSVAEESSEENTSDRKPKKPKKHKT